MADFRTTSCLPSETSFFSELKYDTSSYSCSWDTKFVPDTDVGTIPVYLQVLNKYNIPTDLTNLPPGGTLPGMDINRMSAIDAINLSLAEALILGQWWEIVEDGEGGVYFQNIYDNGTSGKTVTLDARMCIPTSAKTNQVDMVVVTGYDPPPCRYIGDLNVVVPAGPGQVNPTEVPAGLFTIDESLLFTDYCQGLQLRNTATKSYNDPLIEDSGVFQGQVSNPLFDPKAYESLLTWVIKVTGMPTANADAAKVSYHFIKTTSWLRPITEQVTFSKVTEPSEAAFACSSTFTDDSITYYQTEIRIRNQDFVDKYGTNWPLLIRPTNLLYMGYKITKAHSFPTGGGNSTSYVFVDPVPTLIKAGEGSKWVYTLDGDDFLITIYYQPKVSDIVWDEILDVVSTGGHAPQPGDLGGGDGGNQVKIKVDNQQNEQVIATAEDLPNAGAAKTIIGGTDGIGTYVTDMWVEFSIDRPSVIVSTRDNSPARTFSDALQVQYAPIVIFDPPAEIAYKHREFGEHKLDITALSLSEADNDPTTCQNFDRTPKILMQDRMEGNVVNITLPFCQDADACLKVARTIFDYQSYDQVNTYALTCGPDDEPEIGAAVEGYDSNLRIESINYSYNDGSAYSIEVALGPVFSSVGSWGTGTFGGSYDKEDREAIVVWTAGDGVNYRVDVQGLGQFNAINGATMIWRVGERVKVSLNNIPREVP